MPNENIELLYELLAAYEAGDDERMRELFGPDAVIYGAPGIVNAGTYHGFEGFKLWIRQWEDAWDKTSYELGETVEVDESLLVVPAHIVARGAGSGIETDSVFGWLYQFRNGRVIRFEVYASLEETLGAAREIAVTRNRA